MIFKKQKHLLAKRKAANAFRVLRPKEELIDFCSNDYLGLAMQSDSSIGNPIKGSGGSRLLAGNYKEIEELENYLSGFHNSEESLVFNSGYNANVGFFSSVPQKGDTILYDELIHASIKEGMRLNFAKNYSFKHNDISDLKRKLERSDGDVYVVVESVYSMDGDSAPLLELIALKEDFDFCFIVDEAHSIGVFGEIGEGLVQMNNLEKEVDIRVVTFGKAIGSHGAAVLSNRLIKDFLINFSRSFIYTTALPPYAIHSILKSYHQLEKSSLTFELQKKIALFKKELAKNENVELIESNSAIQCVLIPGNNEVKSVSQYLYKAGFDVRPVLSPTVSLGQERLRICLHVFNTDQQILELIKTLADAVLSIRN